MARGFVGWLAVVVLAIVAPFAASAQPLPPPAATPAPPASDDPVSRAAALRDEARPQEAEALLRPVAEARPDDPRVLAALAEAVADQDRSEEAARLYERVVRILPEDEAARTRLAVLLTYAGRLDDALARYRELLAARPADPTLNLAVAEVLLDLDRGPESIPHFEAYLAAVPGDADVLRHLYHVHLWAGHKDRALAVLDRLAERLDADMLAELGGRYEELGHGREAMATWERVLAANPKNLAALKALGRLNEWADDPEEALDHYERYLESAPGDREVLERAATLSLWLGLGRAARGYVRRMGVPGEVYKDLRLDAAFAEPGPAGSEVGVHYDWRTNNQDFSHHRAGPTGAFGIGRRMSLGALYRFHRLSGPDTAGADRLVLGHEGGVFAESLLPAAVGLDGGVSVTGYDTGWTSVNGYLQLGRAFGPVSLELRGERRDLLSTVGDVRREVVANGAILRLYTEPWWRLFASAALEYHRYSDANDRIASEATVGIIALDRPRIEAAYVWSLEHFTDTAPGRSYFNPSQYHAHGALARIRHVATTWFRWDADVRLWHAVRDETLMLTYGAGVAFRIAWRHLLRAGFHRTDTLVGTTSSLYNENLLSAGYVFEF
ncbi:MAG: tetratricopeptide repeat protein [Deltaproteobacteria bacterium]|nr:tetratricopeptide repeat protein [Deltaproteobacteria bacterium]